MKMVRAMGLVGMDNLNMSPQQLIDPDTKKLVPSLLLNCDVEADGRVVTRLGKTQRIALNNCHSLWAGTVMLCVATGGWGGPSLHLIDGSSAQEIGSIDGQDGFVEYAEDGGLVYFSNGSRNFVFDVASRSLREWGLPVGPTPALSFIDGSLPPGKYKLCYSLTEDGRFGGNGPIAVWESTGTFGVQLNSRPANTRVWMTQPNGADYYEAPVVAESITSPDYVEPFPALNVIPPPLFTSNLLAHNGRLWGASGRYLYYSMQFRLEWFRERQRIPFPEDIVLLAPVESGLFVNSRRRTWFLKGKRPKEMEPQAMGDGAVPGTLTYALVEMGGYEISRKLSQMPSPVWMSPTGVVVGTQNGHLVHMTEARLKTNIYTRGAALHWMPEGRPRTLLTLFGAPVGEVNRELREVFDRERVMVPAPLERTLYGGVIVSGSTEVAFT